MRERLRWGVLAACLLPLYGCASLGKQPELVRETLAENGMKTLYWQPSDQSDGVVELALVVSAGSLAEQESERGFAHFVEHMAFNGTEDYPKEALQARLKSLGMTLGNHVNASTGFEETVYRIRLDKATPEQLAEALDLMAQWAMKVRFDPQEVNQEKPVILEEWRLRMPKKTDPRHAIMQAYYQGSELADRLPIGVPETIEAASPEALRAFYQRWYQPRHTQLIIAGAMDIGQTKQWVSERFSAWQNTEQGSAKVADVQPASMPASLKIDSDQVFGASLSLHWFVDKPSTLSTDEQLRLMLLADALTSVADQRLQAAVLNSVGTLSNPRVNRGLASDQVGELALSVEMPSADIEAGLQTAAGIWKGLLAGVSAEEFNAWRERVLNHERGQRDSAEGFMFRALDHAKHQLPLMRQVDYIAWLDKHLTALSVDELNRFITEHLSDSPKTVLLTDAAKDPWSSERIATALSGAKAIEAAALPVASSSESIDWSIKPRQRAELIGERELQDGVVEWRFANGTRALFKQTDAEPGKVAYRLLSAHGMNVLTQPESIHARLALQTLSASGLRQLSGQDLAQWLNQRGLQLQPFYDFFTHGLVGSGPADELALQLRLLHVALTESRVDPQAWQYFSALNLKEIARVAEAPEGAWSRMMSSVLFANDAALRGLTAEEVAQVTPEDLERFYQRHFAGAQDYTLVLVGDVEQAQAKALISQSIATLPKRRVESAAERPYPRFRPAPEPVVVRGSGEQAGQAVLHYRLPKAALRSATVPALHVFGQWLQQALFDDVREKAGAVYSIQALVDGAARAQQDFVLTINYAADPEALEAVKDRIEQSLARLSQQAPTQAELSTRVKAILTERERRLQKLDTLAGTLARPVFMQIDPEASLMSFDQPKPELLQRWLQQFLSEKADRLQLHWLP